MLKRAMKDKYTNKIILNFQILITILRNVLEINFQKLRVFANFSN